MGGPKSNFRFVLKIRRANSSRKDGGNQEIYGGTRWYHYSGNKISLKLGVQEMDMGNGGVIKNFRQKIQGIRDILKFIINILVMRDQFNLLYLTGLELFQIIMRKRRRNHRN